MIETLKGTGCGNTILLPDTDIKESEWLAELLRRGLLKARFIPPQPILDVRDLVRSRTLLIQECSREMNRVQKVLETATIKLSSVVRDVMGASGRAMIGALISGEQSPEVLGFTGSGIVASQDPAMARSPARTRRCTSPDRALPPAGP